MSKIELLAKIELLNKYEAMIDEMKSEADSIHNSIKCCLYVLKVLSFTPLAAAEERKRSKYSETGDF